RSRHSGTVSADSVGGRRAGAMLRTEPTIEISMARQKPITTTRYKPYAATRNGLNLGSRGSTFAGLAMRTALLPRRRGLRDGRGELRLDLRGGRLGGRRRRRRGGLRGGGRRRDRLGGATGEGTLHGREPGLQRGDELGGRVLGERLARDVR